MREEWRPVTGYPEYAVSNFGRVKRVIKYNKVGIIKSFPDSRGKYRILGLHRKNTHRTFLVHRLVAREFIGERPEGYQINHIDGNKQNNRAVNLEYITGKENRRLARKMGLYPEGSQMWNAKLTEKDVLEIRKLYKPKSMPFYKLAEKYGVSTMAVYRAWEGKRSWDHI